MSEQVRQQRIRVDKATYRRAIFRKFTKLFSWLMLAAVTVYLCFAVTLLRVIPATNGLGLSPVRNTTFTAGAAPTGEIVVTSTTAPQGRTALDRLVQSVVPTKNVAKVEIVAGPFGKLDFTTKGATVVDGRVYPIVVSNPPSKHFLEKEYLVKCLGGDCVKDTGMIVPESYFYGEPLTGK